MPNIKNPNKRLWQPRELRLCSEFLARFYPEYESRTHVHLGPSLPRVAGRFVTDPEGRLVGVFRRWADALVFLEDRVILLEVKILPQPGVISQLKLYAELIPKTPELSEHKDKWVEMLLVCAIEDSLISELARREGIRVIIFRPVWIDDYMQIVQPRERTPGLNNI